MKTIGILRLRDIFLLLVLLSLALSCGSDDNGMDCPDPTNADCDQIGDDPQDDDPQDDDPVVLEPTLSSVAPVTGPKHTEVVITGENFGTDATKVSVSFNGTPGEVLGVVDTEVTVKVPARAYTGPITMEVDGFDLTGPEFVYEISEVNVETFAGNPNESPGFLDGSGTEARFNRPYDLVMDSRGNMFVADMSNQAIRKIDSEGEVSTFARFGESGENPDEGFLNPHGLAIDGDDNIYVADSGNDRIVKITPNGVWSIIAGGNGFGYVNGAGDVALFNHPSAILVGEDGNNVLYVSDRDNHAIRRISLDDDQYTVNTYAGPEVSGQDGYMDGGLSDARFNDPWGMAKSGETILLVDYANNRIRAIDQKAESVERFAGSSTGGHAGGDRLLDAMFKAPTDISVAGDGTVFIADTENSCIRQIDPDGHVTTIAGVPETEGYEDGLGDVALFQYPFGVLSGGAGEIYVADTFNHAIRKILME
ncbi:IPT/TIG domain-containing protein [Flagellimonas algicola]|uniref:IPT/TIG domain-containing protein n=1 Tax=Flagellimonas algicola TaxID=2583815 RepID=A0ABY2WG72_9FLAO|nr:IPT/TIG domain-containing protein [Allomuricauda algicola]TMU50411.1 hypothetical protein FGG15_19885 [Allomuricauda algicola]